MKLDAIANLGTRLWQMRTRAELGPAAAAGLLEAFEADGAIVWLSVDGGPCEPDDISLAGPIVQGAPKDDMATAMRAGRLEQWIAQRGGVIYNGADLGGDEESCGMVAVAWRTTRRMPAYVDAFLALLAEQLKALLEREAVLDAFQVAPAAGGMPAEPGAAPLRVVARRAPMGALLDQAPDAVLLHSMRGKIIDANVAACTMLGYPRRELIGTNLAALLAPGASARLPWLRPNFAEATRVRTDYVLRHKDGHPVRLMAATRVVNAGGEQVALMIGREGHEHPARQATQRVIPPRAVPAAAVSPARSIVESTTDLVIARDAQGRYVHANAACCAVVGRPLGDIVGKTDTELLPAEAARTLSAAHLQVLSTGHTIAKAMTLPVGGHPRRFMARVSPWRDEHARVLGVVVVASDGAVAADERRHAEMLQELTAANERTERMLADQRRMTDRASSLLGIARTLGTGLDAERARAVALAAIEQHIPGAACAVGSYDAVTHQVGITAYGRSADLLRFDDDVFRAYDASFGDDLLKGCTYTRMRLGPSDYAVDTRLRTRGARGLAAVPLLNGGKPAGVVLLAWPQDREPQIDDVTLVEHVAAHLAQALDNARLYDELKESVASLRSAQDQVVRTQRLRALGEMAAGVAHDFNNSLTTILGLTEWLLHSLPEENEVRGDLSTIRTAATDAAAIIRRLQMFGKSVPHTTSAEPVNLAELAALIPDMVKARLVERQARDGVTFDIVVEGSPVPLVRAVPGEIRELLLNLVLNAVDAMPAGGRITIRTRQTRGGAQVSVVDAGVGMPEDVKRRVFEPFFTTKGGAGNGLGLSVCWGIAERHGGTLTVESSPDAGSTFTLTLPAAAGRGHAEKRTATATARPAPTARNLRILFVDDQADVRESVTDMLGALGHHVTQADGGSAALERLGEAGFDLLVTDLGMDGMNGLELAQAARARHPSLPVVLLTGWGADYEGQTPADVTLVVSKPVTLKSLREAVSRAVAGVAEAKARIS